MADAGRATQGAGASSSARMSTEELKELAIRLRMAKSEANAKLLLELRDLSKEAKETLYQFHREHEPNAALRFLRQRVWLWRRMDPGMMTRNLVLLYAFLMAEFHYKEHSRARELEQMNQELAAAKVHHEAVENRVRDVSKRVEAVLQKDKLYADSAWNAVRREYGRFAFEMSREMAAAASAKSAAGAAGDIAGPDKGPKGQGWGQFRYVNPYWWAGYAEPPAWMAGTQRQATAAAGATGAGEGSGAASAPAPSGAAGDPTSGPPPSGPGVTKTRPKAFLA